MVEIKVSLEDNEKRTVEFLRDAEKRANMVHA